MNQETVFQRVIESRVQRMPVGALKMLIRMVDKPSEKETKEEEALRIGFFNALLSVLSKKVSVYHYNQFVKQYK